MLTLGKLNILLLQLYYYLDHHILGIFALSQL